MTEADKWDPSPLDALLLPYTGVDEAYLSKHPEGPRGVPTYPGLHNEAGLFISPPTKDRCAWGQYAERKRAGKPASTVHPDIPSAVWLQGGQ